MASGRRPNVASIIGTACITSVVGVNLVGGAQSGACTHAYACTLYKGLVVVALASHCIRFAAHVALAAVVLLALCTCTGRRCKLAPAQLSTGLQSRTICQRPSHTCEWRILLVLTIREPEGWQGVPSGHVRETSAQQRTAAVVVVVVHSIGLSPAAPWSCPPP